MARDHRAPRARPKGRICMPPGRFTRDTSQETFSSPATHAITSRLDSMVHTRSPLASVFSLMALRWLVWIVWPAADAVRGVFVFMARIFAAPSIPVHVQKQEIRT